MRQYYLAPLSGVLPDWIIKLTNCPSRVIHVDPQAVVVPGLAGMFLFFEVLADLTVRFLDAHAHIIENGFMMELPLAGSKSVQGDVQPITLQNLTYLITKYCSDVVERVKAYILSHPDVHNDTTQWIEGWGWDQTKWSKAQFPIAVRLDFTTVQTISSC